MKVKINDGSTSLQRIQTEKESPPDEVDHKSDHENDTMIDLLSDSG